MPKSPLLLIAAAIVSMAVASSANSAVPNDQRFDSTQFLGDSRAVQTIVAADLRLNDNGFMSDSDATRADNSEAHVAKAGLWGSIKSAAKKVGSAAKSVASNVKRMGAGVKSVAKTIVSKAQNAGYKGMSSVAGAVKNKLMSAAKTFRKIVRPVADAIARGTVKVVRKVS